MDVDVTKLLSKEDKETIALILNNALMASREFRAAAENVNRITSIVRGLVESMKGK